MREVSDLLLERYLLDELPPADKAALTQRLAADPALRARLDDLRRATEDFARTRDAGAFARTVRERLRRDRVHQVHAGSRTPVDVPQGGPRFAGWKPALGGVFLLALVAVPAWRVLNGPSSLVPPGPPGAGGRPDVAEPGRPVPDAPGAGDAAGRTSATDTDIPVPETRGKPAPARTDAAPSASAEARTAAVRAGEASPRPATRLKGLQPTLALFRRIPGGAEPLKPGASVRAGDVLRIGYRAAGRSFGAIFSVDGHGNVTRHWPLAGDLAARLAPGETLLPGAFELDDAPSYERFFLLVSEAPFDLTPMLESLQASRPSPQEGVEVIRFDLVKEQGI